MAKARRAKTRLSRVLVPLLAVAVLAVAVVTWQVRAGGVPVRSQQRTGDGAASASASASPSAGARSAAAAAGEAALESCRRNVAATEEVLVAARTGIGHWSAHVQAQTDADAGLITVEQLNAVFARTRRAGPADEERYREARAQAENAGGSCASVVGAERATDRALARCRARAAAARPVLRAAAPAMADWRHHLQDMMASRMHQVSDPDQVWIEAWRAAPPHIEAYERALDAFDAPRC